MAATMQDVATLAQVSLSTVSYTLSGKRPVSAETRAKIESAMAELVSVGTPWPAHSPPAARTCWRSPTRCTASRWA